MNSISNGSEQKVSIWKRALLKNCNHIAMLLLLAFLMTAPGRADAASVIDSFNDVSGSNAVEGSALTPFSTTATAGGIGFTTGYDPGNSSVDVLRTNDLTVSLANYVSGQTNSANHWSVSATVATAGLARRAWDVRVVPNINNRIAGS